MRYLYGFHNLIEPRQIIGEFISRYALHDRVAH
jgi:hypothetical protein